MITQLMIIKKIEEKLNILRILAHLMKKNLILKLEEKEIKIQIFQ